MGNMFIVIEMIHTGCSLSYKVVVMGGGREKREPFHYKLTKKNSLKQFSQQHVPHIGNRSGHNTNDVIPNNLRLPLITSYR